MMEPKEAAVNGTPEAAPAAAVATPESTPPEIESGSAVSVSAPTSQNGVVQGEVKGVEPIKPVNPLRLARPLEKSQPGLSRTTIPPTRPMPFPTVSPLCPPGSKPKPGSKPEGDSGSNNGTPAKPEAAANSSCQGKVEIPVSQPLKPTIQPDQSSLNKQDDKKAGEEEKKAAPPAVASVEAVKTAEPSAPNASAEAIAASTAKEKAAAENAATVEDLNSEPPAKPIIPKGAAPLPKKASSPAPPKKSSSPGPPVKSASPVPPKKNLEKLEKNQIQEKKDTALQDSPQEKDTKKSGAGSRSPNKPKIPVAEKTPRQKRKIERVQEPVPEEEKRSSKRSRVPTAIYESQDPELDQIMKTIKKQEEEERKEKGDVTPKAKVEKKVEVKKVPVKESAKKKARDPVFFKDEFLAVRNPEDGFYICKAMQNIFIGSKNIKIQWFSNEPHIIPAKDNPQGDIFAPDFYDKTDFETIITSVEMDKVLGKSKRQILPEEELERIKKILQRAKDKAEGKLEIDSLLTEDNPEGLDISLYEGEDQLDEIERRRRGEEKNKKKGKKEEKDDEKETKKEVKIKVKPPTRVEEAGERVGRRVEKRKSAENAKHALEAYEFADSMEAEEEASPKLKKRKSLEGKKEKEVQPAQAAKETVQKETEELSTSERAILEAREKEMEKKTKVEKEEKEEKEKEKVVTEETVKEDTKPSAEGDTGKKRGRAAKK